jgi:hypothetical protein
MTDTPMREHALALAARGFRVFKLEVWGKHPVVENWPESASCDADTVRAMWTLPWGEALDNNVGVLAGGDLMVIDVDQKNGAHGDASLDYLVDSLELDVRTFTVRTPTGGRHIYFRTGAEVRNSVRALGDGLDVRGWHGFVVGPGSETWQGRYEILADKPIAMAPDWLVSMCGRARRCAPESGTRPAAGTIELDAQADLERAVRWLEDEAPTAVSGNGRNNETYRVAARLGDLGVSEAQAVVLMMGHWNELKVFPPYEWELLEARVGRSYKYRRRPLGVASPLVEFDAVELAPDPVRVKHSKNGKPTTEWVDQVMPGNDNPYLIKGWLDAGMISILYGATGASKSFAALDMGWHVGAGKAWNGCEVKRGLVLYVALEGGAGIKKRLVALRRRHGTGCHLAAMRWSIDLRPGAKDAAELVLLTREAEKDCGGLPVALIIIDTLSRAIAGLDENSASDMNGVMKVVEGICETLQCHVMLVHHSGKDAARGARGSSALKAATDTELEVVSEGPEGTLSATKQRDIDGTMEAPFVRETIEVGKDADGKAIFSCVIRWRSKADIEFGPVELNDGQSQLLEFLDLLDEGDGVVESDWWAHAQANWRESKHGKWRLSSTQAAPISLSRLRAIRLSLLKLNLIYKNEKGQWFRRITQS